MDVELMPNRFLTHDEITVEVTIPMLRSMLISAAKRAASSAERKAVSVPNPIRDCMPVSFDPAVLTPDGMRDSLQKLDEMEVVIRDRIAERESKNP